MSEQHDSADREVYTGKYIQVWERTLPRPGGGERHLEQVNRGDAVAIVATRAGEQGRPLVALVRQQRPVIGQETWEIPAGLVEPDERDHPEQTARRELREETAFEAGDLQRLTREYSSPGFTTERVTIFLARDVRPTTAQVNPDEIAQVKWLPFADALAMCHSGELEDAKTLIGLLLARDALAPTA